MHIKSMVFGVITLPLLSFASPMPDYSTILSEGFAPDGTPFSSGINFFNETNPVPRTERHSGPNNSPLAKRAEFCGYITNFSKNDIDGLVNWLQNTDSGKLVNLPHQSATWFKWGSAQICVQNEYVFENTHLKRWEAGWAAGYIRDRCCGGSGSQCNGGYAQCHGDSGLTLDALLLASSYDCTIYL